MATECCIAQAEVDTAFTGVQFLQFLDRTCDRFGHFHALQKSFATDGGILAFVGFLVDLRSFRDCDNGQAEMLREAPVALIASGNCHHGTGTVAGQHVVTHPDRHIGSCERMFCIGSGEHTTHLVDLGLALALAAVAGGLHVGFDLGTAIVGGVLADQHMLRRKGDEGHTEQGIRPRCEDLDEVIADGETYGSAFTSPDPVPLRFLQ